MKREIISRTKVLLFTFFAVLCTTIVTACGSDDEEEQQNEIVTGPDKDGWYTYKDKYSIYDGEVVFTDDAQIVIDTESPVNYYRLYCINITKQDCDTGDKVKIKVLRYKYPDFWTTNLPVIHIAEVELLNVKKQ